MENPIFNGWFGGTPIFGNPYFQRWTVVFFTAFLKACLKSLAARGYSPAYITATSRSEVRGWVVDSVVGCIYVFFNMLFKRWKGQLLTVTYRISHWLWMALVSDTVTVQTFFEKTDVSHVLPWQTWDHPKICNWSAVKCAYWCLDASTGKFHPGKSPDISRRFPHLFWWFLVEKSSMKLTAFVYTWKLMVESLFSGANKRCYREGATPIISL